mmetsp:Transcript_8245/g.18896  ORF Transcript_8245/g.18896 Transcript_8245/m.18896 type:complete len:458 (+) Transcript_8245:138-1511(+)
MSSAVQLADFTDLEDRAYRRAYAALLKDLPSAVTEANVTLEWFKQWLKHLTHKARGLGNLYDDNRGHIDALDSAPPVYYTAAMPLEEAFDLETHPTRAYNRDARKRAEYRGTYRAIIDVIQATLPPYMYCTLMCDNPDEPTLLKKPSDIVIYDVIRAAATMTAKPTTTDEDAVVAASDKAWTGWFDGTQSWKRHIAKKESDLDRFNQGRTPNQIVRHMGKQIDRVSTRAEFKPLVKAFREWRDVHPVGDEIFKEDLDDLWDALHAGHELMSNAQGFSAETVYEEAPEEELTTSQSVFLTETAQTTLEYAEGLASENSALKQRIAQLEAGGVPPLIDTRDTSRGLSDDERSAFLSSVGDVTREVLRDVLQTTQGDRPPRGELTPFSPRDLNKRQQKCKFCRELGVGRPCYNANETGQCKSSPRFTGDRGYLQEAAVKSWEERNRPKRWRNWTPPTSAE